MNGASPPACTAPSSCCSTCCAPAPRDRSALRPVAKMPASRAQPRCVCLDQLAKPAGSAFSAEPTGFFAFLVVLRMPNLSHHSALQICEARGSATLLVLIGSFFGKAIYLAESKTCNARKLAATLPVRSHREPAPPAVVACALLSRSAEAMRWSHSLSLSKLRRWKTHGRALTRRTPKE